MQHRSSLNRWSAGCRPAAAPLSVQDDQSSQRPSIDGDPGSFKGLVNAVNAHRAIKLSVVSWRSRKEREERQEERSVGEAMESGTGDVDWVEGCFD
jgi:hypothetical protein